MIIFDCEKRQLQTAVAIASRAVPSKSSVSALEGLLLQAGPSNDVAISGYNMTTGIRILVPSNVAESGNIVLNAKLFGDILRRMPDDRLTVRVDGSLQVRLTCGDCEYQIPGMEADDYPDLPKVDGSSAFTVKQGTLRAMIEETAYAVSTSDSRPIQTGVLFEVDNQEVTMAAVDGFRLAVRKEPLDKAGGDKFSFVAPGVALNDVKNICANSGESVTVTMGDRHILFETDEAHLICRRLEGEFLNYRGVIPQNQPIRLTVETRDLMNSIDRVGVVISEQMKKPVRCLFENGHVTLTARTLAGEARDVCPVDGNGDGLEIGFNNRYLMEALRYAPAERVRMELNNGTSPALILPEDNSDKFLYMVLPVRLSA